MKRAKIRKFKHTHTHAHTKLCSILVYNRIIIIIDMVEVKWIILGCMSPIGIPTS